MYEYEFETVAFGLLGKPQSDYKEVVRQRAALGWRLAHIVRVPSDRGGGEAVDLVFERAARGPQDATRADGPASDDQPAYQPPPSRG